jgi:hypothetical protein
MGMIGTVVRSVTFKSLIQPTALEHVIDVATVKPPDFFFFFFGFFPVSGIVK